MQFFQSLFDSFKKDESLALYALSNISGLRYLSSKRSQIHMSLFADLFVWAARRLRTYFCDIPPVLFYDQIYFFLGCSSNFVHNLKLDFQDGNISTLSVKRQSLDINKSFFCKNCVKSDASPRFWSTVVCSWLEVLWAGLIRSFWSCLDCFTNACGSNWPC